MVLGGNRQRRAQRGAWRVLLAAGLVAAGSLAGSAPAAAVGFTYSATATGVASRTVFSAQGAPLAESPVDIGGPIAQVRLDSVGTSQALAAAPYPGELVLTAPGLIGGSAPDAPKVPPYPFAARAEQPLTPEARSGDERTRLEAQARPDVASALAQADAGGEDAAIGFLGASASVVAADDVVVATAESTAEAVVVGPIRISNVKATAGVVLGPQGIVERTSSFLAEGASIGGIEVRFTPEGVVVADNEVPLQQDEGVAEALREAGIELRFLAEEQTPNGVVGAGLEIVRTQDFGSFGQGSMTVVLGQAIATGAVGDPRSVAEPGPDVWPSVSAGLSLPPVFSSAPEPVDVLPAVPAAASTPNVVRPAPARSARVVSTLNRFDMGRIYPVLFLGAAGLVFAARAGGRRLRPEKVR